MGVDVQENPGGTPEARSRLCVCRASFLMTFVTGGIPSQMGAQESISCWLGFWSAEELRMYVCVWLWTSGSCRSFTFLSLHFQKRIVPATETYGCLLCASPLLGVGDEW